MNTIKFTVLVAPLCGHQSFQEGCLMCKNIHRATRDISNRIKQTQEATYGVAITVVAFEDTSGDTSANKGKET